MAETGDEEVFCAWSDVFLVDVSKVDEQHRGLFAALRTLQGLILDQADAAALDRAFVRLLRLTQAHFATEEALMREHGYPASGEHQAMHELLLKQLEDLRSGQQEALFYHLPPTWASKLDLVDFLHEWLINHILDADKKLGAFLKDRGVD